MNRSAIPVFLKTATIQRHTTELLQELDAAKKLSPISLRDWIHKQALVINVRSDIATNCRILRLYHKTHNLPVVEA